MPFKKGVSGNPNGRPVGVKDKVSVRILETLADIFEDNIETFKDDIKALDSKDRVAALLKLCDYYVPKATTKIDITSHSVTIENILEELAEEN